MWWQQVDERKVGTRGYDEGKRTTSSSKRRKEERVERGK
jgi:hypothetical protein